MGSITACRSESDPAGWSLGRVVRILIPLALIAIMVAVLSTVEEEQLEWLIERLQGEWRTWAIPGLILIGAGLTAVGFPGTFVSLAAGAAFGFLLGYPVALASAFGANCLTVCAGRVAGHRGSVQGDGWLARVQRAMGDADWRFVALLRLAPVLPYAAVNFTLGSWRVPWRAVLMGTALGLLPGTAAHVYLGAAGRRLLGGGDLHPLEWALLVVGVLSIPLTGWLFAGMVRRRTEGADAT